MKVATLATLLSMVKVLDQVCSQSLQPLHSNAPQVKSYTKALSIVIQDSYQRTGCYGESDHFFVSVANLEQDL